MYIFAQPEKFHFIWSRCTPHIMSHLYIYGIVAAKRDLVHIFSSFQIIVFSKRHLCPLQLLSYALEISLSIMELQWPGFLITHTFLLHASTLKFHTGICARSLFLFAATTPYIYMYISLLSCVHVHVHV